KVLGVYGPPGAAPLHQPTPARRITASYGDRGLTHYTTRPNPVSVEWLSESYRLRCALRQRGWSRVPRLRRQASRLRAATRSLDRCPQKREQVDKATGPAATERLGGGGEKSGGRRKIAQGPNILLSFSPKQ